MRPTLTLTVLLLVTPITATAAQPCQKIHGRAIYYTTDGQLRIWHIGTHHEFAPPPTTEDEVDSWGQVVQLLRHGGGTDVEAFDRNALFADFVVCPTEPFRKGAVQSALVKRIYHLHIVPRDSDGEPK